MFSYSSGSSEIVDNMMLFIVSVSVFLLVGITAAMIFFIIKYNRKRHPVAKQIEGNLFLEIIWVGFPTVLVLIMFYYGFEGFKKLRASANFAMKVQVIGRMWEWKFTYENGKKSDTLYIPLGKTTKLEMKSADVNHSFFIPAYRLKEDVIASRTTYLMLTPRKTGAFDVECTEYCGVGHSAMLTKIVVVSLPEFEAWLNDSTSGIKKNIAGNKGLEYGKELLKTKGCLSCHTLDGSKLTGPSFKELAKGKVTVLIDDAELEVPIDDDYIKQSIMDPNSEVVKGYAKYTMPENKGRINEEELRAIVEYLKTIK
jgi:cytochrome c oxidase subunit II